MTCVEEVCMQPFHKPPANASGTRSGESASQEHIIGEATRLASTELESNSIPVPFPSEKGSPVPNKQSEPISTGFTQTPTKSSSIRSLQRRGLLTPVKAALSSRLDTVSKQTASFKTTHANRVRELKKTYASQISLKIKYINQMLKRKN